MKKFLFASALALVTALAFVGCSKDDEDKGTPSPAPSQDKYTGGFYVVNEGSFGHTPASINYYTPDGGWTLNLFQTNNPDETLGNTGSMAVYSDDFLYVVTKETPYLTEIGFDDFLKRSSLPEGELSSQAHALALIDDSHGVLITGAGAYSVTLNPVKLGSAFYEGRDLWGDVCVKNGYIFMTTTANAEHKIKVYNAQTLESVKELSAATTGFAEVGGYLWAANGNKLVKIDMSTLTDEELTLSDGLSVYYNKWAYTPSALSVSKEGNALFFLSDVGGSGTDVYKYSVATNTAEKFFAAPETYSVYGKGLNVDPKTGDLYLFYTSDWGANITIYVVDGKTGEQKNTIAYTDTSYWYPSMVIFR